MRTKRTHPARSIATVLMGLAMLGACAPAAAQPLTWGFKGGVSVADLYGDRVPDTEVRARFSGGAFVTYRVSELFAVQPEVLFSMKGAETETAIDGTGAGPTTYSLAYLEVPLLARFYFPTRSALQPSLYAGPFGSLLLYGEADDREIDDALEEGEVGLAFGGGLDVLLGSRWADPRVVTLDARYAIGLTDVWAAPDAPDARNGTLTVSIGFGL